MFCSLRSCSNPVRSALGAFVSLCLFLLSFGLVAGACDDSPTLPDAGDAGGGDLAPAQTVPAACAAMWSAYAVRELRCTGYVVPANEVADIAVECEWRASLPGIDTTPGALYGCAALLPTSACTALPPDCVIDTDGEDPEDPLAHFLVPRQLDGYYGNYSYFELFPRFHGTLAEGKACVVAMQCASGRCQYGNSSCGVCVSVAPLGAACGSTVACGEGVCEGSICTDKRLGPGARCVAPKGESVCQHGLYCSGTCEPLLPDGAACRMLSPTNECQPGSRCDRFQCMPIRTVALGAACNGLTTLCAEGVGCIGGVCATPRSNLQIGDFCVGNQCAPGLTCAYSICARPLAEGAPCHSMSECGNGASCGGPDYLNPTCWALRAEGQACPRGYSCQPGLYCDVGSKRCKRDPAVGESCDATAACRLNLSCDQGRCVEARVCQ